MKAAAFMIIEQGTPYENGAFIPLSSRKTIIGRKSKENSPDIPFQNIHISREHAAIIQHQSGEFFIEDLGSKHGTWLNRRPLTANQQIPLRNSDNISLAGGLIKFSFTLTSLELTADLVPMGHAATPKEFQLNPIRQELTVNGAIRVFSEKEFKCLEVLLNNHSQFIYNDDIKETVWPERKHSEDSTPDVTPEEINALIYRIRKKLPECLSIENIRSRGYILSIQDIT
ncbi:FHA domain-containing protein [Bacillus salacetis]|uniref:FHA domain-containing protein n=1 Tax=Bacillus salacetis TaxID=2315464 RepID=A0A3A1RCW6_9BACI|nr:FHA domain-containing protein [Bacillus salacetis]RIW38795.1 FHA domain-containing protein [Bacillus salacetis]